MDKKERLEAIAKQLKEVERRPDGENLLQEFRLFVESLGKEENIWRNSWGADAPIFQGGSTATGLSRWKRLTPCCACAGLTRRTYTGRFLLVESPQNPSGGPGCE